MAIQVRCALAGLLVDWLIVFVSVTWNESLRVVIEVNICIVHLGVLLIDSVDCILDGKVIHIGFLQLMNFDQSKRCTFESSFTDTYLS